MAWVNRCVAVLLLGFTMAGAALSPAAANSKYAAFVMHADSGDVLFNRYSTERRYPASLTKMMTLYLLFEEIDAGRLSLDSKLKVSPRAAGQPPSKLGVKAGSTIDAETAIRALIVKSANDVAVVVAESVSGSEWKFAQKMTKKARSIGMRRTTFRNASGLPNSRQLTTARDLAVLSRRVMQDFPQYYDYFAEKSFVWNGRTYRTHNALVKTYPGADGLKTGYTRRSGFNLATTATREGNRLIGVVLGGRSVRTRDRHMKDILDQGFAAIKKKPTLISALHRTKPSPRVKPSLLPAPFEAAPTIASNDALQSEIFEAAAIVGGAADAAGGDMATLQPTAYVSEPGGVPQNASQQDADMIGALILASESEKNAGFASAFGASTFGAATSTRSADAIVAGFSDDFNEYELLRLSDAGPTGADDEASRWGQGDLVSRDWRAQVGAYNDKRLAQEELEEAARAAGLGAFERRVTPISKQNGEVMYRARFIYLSENDAREICETLRAKKRQCIALKEPTSR